MEVLQICISRHGEGLLAEGHVYSAWSLVMVFLPVVMFIVVTGHGLLASGHVYSGHWLWSDVLSCW